jgi:hypothetical protein
MKRANRLKQLKLFQRQAGLLDCKIQYPGELQWIRPAQWHADDSKRQKKNAAGARRFESGQAREIYRANSSS